MSQRFCPISSELSDLRILHEFPIDKSKNIVTSEVHVFFQGFGRCRYGINIWLIMVMMMVFMMVNNNLVGGFYLHL